MSGWNTIERIRRIEKQIDALGFKFAKCKHGDFTDLHGALSLVPKDNEALPIFSRDVELFVGSLEALENWLHGVEWARNYDMMCKISSDKKRADAEQKERNRQLMQIIKTGKRVEGVES
jgi:hypothetical protein